MQKKVIALAVAGLVSGAAFAQTNVTIYGAFDTAFEHVSANGGTEVAPGGAGVFGVSVPGTSAQGAFFNQALLAATSGVAGYVDDVNGRMTNSGRISNDSGIIGGYAQSGGQLYYIAPKTAAQMAAIDATIIANGGVSLGARATPATAGTGGTLASGLSAVQIAALGGTAMVMPAGVTAAQQLSVDSTTALAGIILTNTNATARTIQLQTRNAAIAAANVKARNRMAQNSTHIGFKGTEDLGNGLKALFQVEAGVNVVNNPQTGAGSLTTPGAASTSVASFGNLRDTYVGLSGSFGTVLAGYLSTPFRSTIASYDPMVASTGAVGVNGVFGKATPGTNLMFRTEAVAYVTPSFSGFTGTIAYVPAAGTTNDRVSTRSSVNGTNTFNSVSPGGWNLKLEYANGPVKASYNYMRLRDIGLGTVGAAHDDYYLLANGTGLGAGAIPSFSFESEQHRVHHIGGSFNFGQGTTIMGQYMWYRGDVDTSNLFDYANNLVVPFGTNVDVRRKSWTIGAKHVMGAHEFAASYSRAGDMGGDLIDNNTGASHFALRYGYNFSKRTSVYGYWTRINNESAANFDFNPGSQSNLGSGTPLAGGADPKAWGMGIRHTF